MAYDIIIGRDESDLLKLGREGLVFLGRSYVKMGQTTSLSNNVYLDVAKAHVILVSGKRGSGKSYSLSVIAEEMANLPDNVNKRLAILMLDTMGIFWSMKFPNQRQEELLKEWGLEPKGLNVNIYIPKGKAEDYKKKNIPVDYSFSIKPSELTAEDWCSVFNIKLTSDIGILIERTLEDLNKNFSIDDLIEIIKKDQKTKQEVKYATENRFQAVKNWGLFDVKGSEIKDIIKPGEVSILDISVYTDWNVKSLVVGILAKKLLNERMIVRKYEELEAIKEQQHYLNFEEENKKELPLVWILIDEIHEFLPKTGSTPATNALTALLREGRQPGISLVLATQQPGEISKDVITQSDIILSHRVTAKLDVEALNSIMQTYLTADILTYINNLPRLKGSAIILDDNSERIYPMRVRPKMSWHGGEAPSAVKIKKKLLDLKL